MGNLQLPPPGNIAGMAALLTAWVYNNPLDGEGIVMEARIGDRLHDDVYGPVTLLAGLENEQLTVRLDDGEEKKRTAGHLRVLEDEEQAPTTDAGGHVNGEGEIDEEGEEDGEAQEETAPASVPAVDGEAVQPEAVIGETGGADPAIGAAADAEEGAGKAMYDKVVSAMYGQSSRVGFDTDECDLFFFKSVVSTLTLPRTTA